MIYYFILDFYQIRKRHLHIQRGILNKSRFTFIYYYGPKMFFFTEDRFDFLTMVAAIFVISVFVLIEIVFSYESQP